MKFKPSQLNIELIYPIVRRVKICIADDYRAFEEDEIPGIQLTIGADESGWGYQTGDNSYSGAAYHHKHWAVIGVYRDTNCRNAAKEIINQIKNQWCL